MEKSLPEKLILPQKVNKFPAFYWTPNFVTSFTRDCHVYISGARSTKSKPPSYFLMNLFNIILQSTYRSPENCLYQISPPKPCIHLSCPPYVLRPSHFLGLITRTIFGRNYRNLILNKSFTKPSASPVANYNHSNNVFCSSVVRESTIPPHI